MHIHTQYISILFWFVPLICLLSMRSQVFRQDSSSVSASHRSCVFSKDCEKDTKRAMDKFNCFSKCVTPWISKIYKFICLANDCRISNSLDFWVSWLKKNGFNILCSYQRCYGTPRIDAGPHIPTATKLLLVSVKNNHPVLTTIFLFLLIYIQISTPVQGFKTHPSKNHLNHLFFFNIFCFLKEIFRNITWPPPSNKKHNSGLPAWSHLPSLSIGLLPLGSFGSGQFFLHLSRAGTHHVHPPPKKSG